MLYRLPAIRQRIVCLAILCTLGYHAASQCPPADPPVHLERITLPAAEWIGSGFIKGFLRLLPADYSANPTKKYPLIIYFHGVAAIGDGSQAQLCKIIGDGSTALPGNIENGIYPATTTVGGQSYSFIVLMPQYTQYQSPFNYADAIDDFIDYAIANYRVDPARIYLTGMSSGANLSIDYVGSSLPHAQRVAAVALSSLCYDVSLRPQGPANIAAAGLPIWFVHCELDDPCVVSIPDTWVSQINSHSGAVAPRYTRLPPPLPPAQQPWPFPLEQQILYCRPFYHDTWLALYHPGFRPPTGSGANLYEWVLSNSLEILPVKLKQFSVRYANEKMYLQWITASETDNASFIIERAGQDGRFTTLATIPGKGTSDLENTYTFTDEKPLTQISYYRLVQVDLDGDKQYLGTKKMLNPHKNKDRLVILTSNPFINDLSLFINPDKAQKISCRVTDLNGRKVAGIDGVYQQGTTEINLSTAHLPKGIYLLTAIGELRTESYKIVKQ